MLKTKSQLEALEKFYKESSDIHSEGDKIFTEKNKKRMLKTKSQLEALEKFYKEHMYPSEDKKSEVALELGLSVKQISSWFCHRRLKDKNLLKDETCVSGKQDHSNGLIQDRGSGLRQDSCGSTKQGEYRHFDPKEVESRRIYGQDYLAAALSCENRGRYVPSKIYSAMDVTSSGSSSASHGKLLPLRYSSRDSNSTLMNTEGVNSRGYMMSPGYLYLQDGVEIPAICAVKRQLGRHYREDGPPVGVEFQPLPPGAFDSPIGDPIHESYYVGDPILPNSHSITEANKETNVATVNERCRSDMRPHSSYLKRGGFKRTMWEFDNQDEFSRYPSGQQSFTNFDNLAPDQNSAMETPDYSPGDYSEFNSKNYGTWSKHRVQEKSASHKDRCLPIYDRKVISNETHNTWRQNYNTGAHMFQKREDFEGKRTNSVLRGFKSLDSEDKAQSRRMAKVEKLYKERAVNREYRQPVQLKAFKKNETKMGRTKGDEFQVQDYALKMPSAQELSWKKSIRGSGGEMPTSFSEDETAESSSSTD
ncbi:homeodomain-like superfamily protein isoform X2 [Tasmannia lanceolata]|uniref:homeodomain-like superfamily protein isoform X2 n=1 Tax=Tasmannia lanceolata TaxID=3420 RepID=UPI0040648A2B